MPVRPSHRAKRSKPAGPAAPRVESALAALRGAASKETLVGMARYGIPADNAWGVPVGAIQRIGRSLGVDQALAEDLWKTGIYEARMLAAIVGDPTRLTPAGMDRWCRDFDSWALCDTVCFKLFDRSSHAWGRVAPWARRKEEFTRRAGFALLACLALHDKHSGDEPFALRLPLIERGAGDDRNFVKKGVRWALRSVGRRSRALREASLAVARRLAASSNAAERWVGKDALGDLQKHAAKASR